LCWRTAPEGLAVGGAVVALVELIFHAPERTDSDDLIAMEFVLFVLGLALLVGGAEAVVRGASRLAAAAGVSSRVVGLTVVAFGTSAPEMAVSVRAALSGQGGADMALGNVVGSNIFNVLVILGLAGAIAPLAVSQRLVRIEAPIMIGVSFLLLLLARDGNVSRGDGLLLFAGIIAYTAFAVYKGREESEQVKAEYAEEFGQAAAGAGQIAGNLLLIVAGLGMLALGAQWIVDGAVAIAKGLGVSELAIGLTIVAAGTSLPELATSIVASIRGERDIAVGNVVGSNIFNILAVLGLSAAVGPNGVDVSPVARSFDIPVMTAVAVACLPIFFTGYRIVRLEGFLFLGCYVAYAGCVFLAASHRVALPILGSAVLFVVVPLTALTLATAAIRQIRASR